MNIKKLYELSEKADKILQSDKNSDALKTITDELKPIINDFKKGSIGIAQINTIPGNIEHNSKKIMKYISYASKTGLDTIIFPKYAISGYPLNDASERFPVIKTEANKWLNEILKLSKDINVIILEDSSSKTLNINGLKYVVADNIEELKSVEADIYIYCTPTTSYKTVDFFEQISSFAFDMKKPLVYVNQVGAVDNISFDGGSCLYDGNGKLLARAKSYEEHFFIINPLKGTGNIYPTPNEKYYLNRKKAFSFDYDDEMERIYCITIQGIKDYFGKNGIKHACLGLSGGLDSTVCAVLLTDALGKENVFGISMPSKITTNQSKTDAEKLANNLGIHYIEMPIKEIVSTTNNVFNKMFSKIEKQWNFRYKKSFTNDNIQARTRAVYLWGIANEFESCIPIATSDKSEAYMGYATINGDMSGGYAPIADITKTKLFALARWLNKNREAKDVIPESVLLKRPGAELAIDKKTGEPLKAEDALMPYEFLDEVIWRIENKHESYQDMLSSEFIYEKRNKISTEQKKEWLEKFFKRMNGALYKGSIMPPYIVTETPTINKYCYNQPISSKINHKGTDIAEIIRKLKDTLI